VKVLAASPAILDLYMWLSYRSFKAKGTESIPIFGEFGLANQLGCVEYRLRRFRVTSNNGSTPFAQSGRSVPPRSRRIARASRSGMRQPYGNSIPHNRPFGEPSAPRPFRSPNDGLLTVRRRLDKASPPSNVVRMR
jgi:hypothetical protein